MKDFLRFLFTKTFLVNFTLASITAVALLWLAFQLMGFYTNHGEVVEVPDFTGKSIAELDDFIVDKNVTYRIIDSIYNPDEKPGIVVNQDPEKKSTVKNGRIIYLYITSVLPPKILMPKLIDRSLRQAIAMIESYGLKVGKTLIIPDPCNNCVLKQQVGGKDIASGTPIKKGTIINLVVGKGAGSSKLVSVMDVIGMTCCRAKSKLAANGLSVGALILDGTTIKDTCLAFVYRQSPVAGDSKVAMGTSVDLYLTADESKIELTETKSNEKK